MAKPGPKIAPDRVARILVDASELGDEAAAAKHNVSAKTIGRYREKYADDPIVSDLVRALKESVVADWLTSAKAARARLLSKVEVLALGSDDLRTVAGALKIVHDAVLAEELLNDGRQSDDRAGVGGAPNSRSPLSGWLASKGQPIH